MDDSRVLTRGDGGRSRGAPARRRNLVACRFFRQMIEEETMNIEPKKWNLFKFLRGSGRKSDSDSESAQNAPASEPGRVSWPDIPRLFSRDPWRAMEDFFHDPF